MTTTSDVKALTLNTKTVFSTTAALDRVKIHNNSSLYLQVYYGADAPSAATDPGWHDTIDPGDKPLLGIVGNSSSAFSDRTFLQSTPFQGIITIMPFLPAGAPLASGGVITGGAFCHITGYYPGEYAEGGAGDEAYVQAAKQGRQQVVSGGVQRMYGRSGQADATKNLSLITAGAFAWQFNQVTMPNLYAANKAGLSWIMFYFYGYHGQFQTGAAGAAAVDSHLEVRVTNSGGGVIRQSAGIALYSFGNAAFAPPNVYEIDDHPTRPTITALAISQNALGIGDELRILFVRDGTIGTWGMTHQVDFAVDVVNQSPLFEIPSSIIGAGTSLAYDPTFNPQTW